MFIKDFDLGLFFKTAVAVGGSVVSYFFGGWAALLGILLAFVVFDYITGFVAAAAKGKLSSSVGLIGIAKKIFIFCIVAIAHLADQAIGTQIIRDAAIFFYLANELLSIVENAGRIGVPIPPAILRTVEILEGKSKTKDSSEQGD